MYYSHNTTQKFDSWTSVAQNPYIVITTHSIEQNWNCFSCFYNRNLYDCTSLDVDHRAINLKEIITVTLNE